MMPLHMPRNIQMYCQVTTIIYRKPKSLTTSVDTHIHELMHRATYDVCLIDCFAEVGQQSIICTYVHVCQYVRNMVAQGVVYVCVPLDVASPVRNALNGFDITWHFLAGIAGCAVVISNTLVNLNWLAFIFVLWMWSYSLSCMRSCHMDEKVRVQDLLWSYLVIEFFSQNRSFLQIKPNKSLNATGNMQLSSSCNEILYMYVVLSPCQFPAFWYHTEKLRAWEWAWGWG